MCNRLIIITIITAALQVTGAWAQTGNIQHDPFFPSEKGTASAPDGWGRDPFGSPFSTGSPGRHDEGSRTEGEKLLTGIIYSPNDSIAIISGEALREGDAVGDRKLMQIRKNSVVLMDQSGQREELFLENYSMGK
jgi:hypothetical protein